MQTLKTDLVVIGSGGGLCGAVRASECGVQNIIVLEKQKRLGGVCVMACGVCSVESTRQKAMGCKHTKDILFTEMMEKSGWAADAHVVRAFVETSGKFMDWIESKGIVADIVPERDRCHLLKHGYTKANGKVTENMGDAIIDRMIQDVAARGIQVMTETPATGLLQDETGKITGVTARTKDGEELTIEAKAVLIAAGGFNDNAEMKKKYCARFFDPELPWEFCPQRSTYMGDGIRMALAAGSKPDPHVDIVVGGPTHHGAMSVGEAALSPLVVQVNKLGRRFMAEVMGNDAYFAAANQPDATVYAIFDDAAIEPLVEELVKNKRYVPNEKEIPRMRTLREDLEKENQQTERVFDGVKTAKAMIKADTIEELAAFIGCDAAVLQQTLDRYNHACEVGHDDEMFKDPQWLRCPVKTAPFYGLRMMRFNQCTHGGISIDEHMQVIRSAWRDPIPGLYASGDGASGWCSELGWLGMTSLTWALNSAYLAGEEIASYLQKA